MPMVWHRPALALGMMSEKMYFKVGKGQASDAEAVGWISCVKLSVSVLLEFREKLYLCLQKTFCLTPLPKASWLPNVKQ